MTNDDGMNNHGTNNHGMSVSGPGEGPALVSIILATYNEREIIPEMISGILQYVRDPVEVIVVDDDSPDRTWAVAEGLGDPRVRVIRRMGTRGLASAIVRGIIESRGEVVGWMDADMCMPPSLLPEMIGRLPEYDIVIGSRYTEGGQDLRDPVRVRTSRWVNGFARLILGRGIMDYDSGFIVMRRSVLDKVVPLPYGYGEYFIEFIHRCHQKGMKIHEVPYSFRDREVGESKSAPNVWLFLAHGFGYGIRILYVRFFSR